MGKQILILSMQGSGGSLVVELLKSLRFENAAMNLPSGNFRFPASSEVSSVNKSVMEAIGCDSIRLADFDLSNVASGVREEFYAKAKGLCQDTLGNAESTIWVAEEPLFCLLMPLWKKVVQDGLCIIVWRNPLEVVRLLAEQHQIFHTQGLALWEYYNLAALRGASGLPCMVLSYEELLANPRQKMLEIVPFLKAHGIEGFDDSMTGQVAEQALHSPKTTVPEELLGMMNGQQQFLLQGLRDGSALNWASVPEVSTGCRQGLKELTQFLSLRKAFVMLEETIDHSFSLLDSLQYRFSSVIFKTYRKLIGQKEETLSLTSERKLYALLPRFVKLKHLLRSEQGDGTTAKPSAVSFESSQLAGQYAEELLTEVVICVHNALEDVRAALASIERSRSDFSRLIIVNDGSDEPTTLFLQIFSQDRKWCTLLENRVACGYTSAANQGLQAAKSPFVVLVNSDVVVPAGWLQLLKRCMCSSGQLGIVGPLSNAATWQSIPERSGSSGKWAINEIPSGWVVEDVQALVARVSERRYPRVQLLNGFCLGIKRAVFEKIGYFDEQAFPQGYGEENDFCIRAGQAGFELAVVDDLFVYHAKSKSFGSDCREDLSKTGNNVLKKRYGRTFGTRYTLEIKGNAALERMRRRIATAYLWDVSFTRPMAEMPIKVLFLLPCEPGSGGVHSVMQEARGLNSMNISARVAIPARYRAQHEAFYGKKLLDTVCFYSATEELIQEAHNYDVVVATLFTSVNLLKRIWKVDNTFLPAYYIQDYEPWFISTDFVTKWLALRSYTQVPNLCCFAKTDWICNTVQQKHKVKVHRVMPSVDHSVYFPEPQLRELLHVTTIRIAAMVRPTTPRRRACETMEVFRAIKKEYGDRVEIQVFGARDTDPEFLALNRDFEFVNHGFLTREGVAQLLRGSDIFLDISEWQAFGRTGIEAMACGCVPVLPKKGGVHEYAVDRRNAMVVDSDDEQEVIAAIRFLLESPNFLQTLKINGLRDVQRYSIGLSSRTLALLFMEQVSMARRRKESA